MSYRPAFEGLVWYERGILSLFYTATVLGTASFLAFDFMLLPKALDAGNVENLLVFAFVVSLQLIWAFAFYSVHQRESIARAAALALLPMLFTSLPLGLAVYDDVTKKRPSPVAPVY